MAGQVELAELRGQIGATRTTVKGLIRTARTALAFLTDLEERLEQLEASTAQPDEEAQRDEHRHEEVAAVAQ